MTSDLRVDLNLYRVLDAIYVHGVISAAARALHLTQPAVTHALNRLRAQFDDPLFVRQGNRVMPTERTRAVIADVQRHLRGLQAAAHRQAQVEPARIEQRFVVGIRDVLESIALPQLVERLTREAPRVTLVSRRVALAEVGRELAGGRLDLAIDRRVPTGPQIARETLANDALCVVLRRDHPLLAAGPLRRTDYFAARHVTVSPLGEPNSLDVLLAADGRYRQIQLVCQHYFAACQIAAAGDLLLTLPRSYARQMTTLLPVVARALPLRVKPYAIYAYWHESRDADGAHRWFRERAAEIVRAAALGIGREDEDGTNGA